MWKSIQKEIRKGITQYTIEKNGKPISYKEWITLLKTADKFVEFYTDILRASPFEAFFWEVKPITKNKVDEVFEFVLVESSALRQITASDASFKQYFKEGEQVVSFSNLGGDAQLVVPTKMSETAHYPHLAKFVRNAPQAQVVQFWKRVGEEYEKLIGDKTKWLSTAGLGVYWLHVRVDSRPKYYRYRAYKLNT